MKKALVLFVLLIGITGAVWAACGSDVKCAVHDVATVTFTGKQKFENGHSWYLYHCSAGSRRGHDFWVRCD
jgi:hypothetical protein